MTNTHPNIKGFRSVIDHIPDEDVRKLKGYFQKYAADYRKGGIQGFAMEAIGVDMDFLNGIMNEEGAAQQIAYCVKHPARLSNMVGALDKKLPEFKEFLQKSRPTAVQFSINLRQMVILTKRKRRPSKRHCRSRAADWKTGRFI
ncbi:hypothetical protein AAGG52_01895 [Bacillus licheniformis]